MKPERHAEAQLELSQAAATRSCTYLRCANLGGEGGPAAGEGVGSMRCRWAGGLSMRLRWSLRSPLQLIAATTCRTLSYQCCCPNLQRLPCGATLRHRLLAR